MWRLLAERLTAWRLTADRTKLGRIGGLFMDDPWYKQQVEALGEALQELVSDDSPERVREGLRDAIASWMDYHEEELKKWAGLKLLLGL